MKWGHNRPHLCLKWLPWGWGWRRPGEPGPAVWGAWSGGCHGHCLSSTHAPRLCSSCPRLGSADRENPRALSLPISRWITRSAWPTPSSGSCTTSSGTGGSHPTPRRAWKVPVGPLPSLLPATRSQPPSPQAQHPAGVLVISPSFVEGQFWNLLHHCTRATPLRRGERLSLQRGRGSHGTWNPHGAGWARSPGRTLPPAPWRPAASARSDTVGGGVSAPGARPLTRVSQGRDSL